MVRINTRIRPDQHKFIKELAKKRHESEGDAFRSMIDAYIFSEVAVTENK